MDPHLPCRPEVTVPWLCGPSLSLPLPRIALCSRFRGFPSLHLSLFRSLRLSSSSFPLRIPFGLARRPRLHSSRLPSCPGPWDGADGPLLSDALLHFPCPLWNGFLTCCRPHFLSLTVCERPPPQVYEQPESGRQTCFPNFKILWYRLWPPVMFPLQRLPPHPASSHTHAPAKFILR